MMELVTVPADHGPGHLKDRGRQVHSQHAPWAALSRVGAPRPRGLPQPLNPPSMLSLHCFGKKAHAITVPSIGGR
jgi:hypothetical protein